MSEQHADDVTNSAQDSSGRVDGRCCPSCGGNGKVLLVGVMLLAGVYLWTTHRQSSAPAMPSAVPWIESYDAAVARATERHQPVLVAFKASWCGPCKWMDREVFAKPEAAKLLQSWVPVHIDIDKHSEIADRYQIHGVPTFIVLSPSGKEIDRIDGALSIQELAAFLASAQEKMSTIAHAG